MMQTVELAMVKSYQEWSVAMSVMIKNKGCPYKGDDYQVYPSPRSAN